MGTASISKTSSTTSSITVSGSYSGGNPMVNKATFFIDSNNGSLSTTYTFGLSNSNTTSHTYSSGISSGTEYKCYVRYYDSGGSQVAQSIGYFTSSSATPSDDHGNSTGTATTMSLPSSVGGSTSRSGSIETSGDEDYFKFTTSSSGAGTYRFYSSSGWDTQGYLYNSGGSQLSWDDDSGDGNNFNFTYDLSASTTYYFKVRGYSSNTGSYTFYIERQSAISSDDHGNNTSSATTITLPSSGKSTWSGNIEVGDDLDYFKFTTPSGGGTYKFYTTGSTDTKGYLYNTSLTELNYNDDNSSLGGSTNFGFTHTLAGSTTYYLKVTGYSSSTTGAYTLNIEKDVTPPSGVGTITTGTITTTSIQIYWNSATGADKYFINYKAESSANWIDVATGGYVGTSYTITGLTPNTVYDFKVYANNAGGNGDPSYLYGIATNDAKPTTPTNFRATTTNSNGFVLAWDSVATATGYSLEAYHTSTGSLSYQNIGFTGTSATITGLSQYVTYDLKLWAVNSYGNSNPVWIYGVKTLDATAPTISASGDGIGRVYASWTASDAHSGIKSSSPYQVYIGTAGGTTSSLVSIGYTSNLYYTFSGDANGNSFVHNSTYPVRIRVYDNEGNSTYQDLSIKYTMARPSNWSWWTTKSAGQVVQDNIQASEWTSFCTKINQFRTYKNLSLYSFTSVSSGGFFTEAIFAEGRNAISAMSPPTAVNALYKENNVWILRATDLNNLRDSLNSIP